MYFKAGGVMKRGISTRGRGKKLVHNISFRGTLNSKPKYAALLFLCFLVFLAAMPSGAMGGTLTVTKNGTGTGTVTSNDGYINCGVTCSHNYTNVLPTNVTLTPTPDVSSTFASWTGCDSVNGNQCTVSMSLLGGNKTVTATFNIKTFTVTANANGNGTGSVASNTGGINYNYPAASTGTTSAINYGTNVVLTASSGTGSTTSWADCAGAGGTPSGNGTSTATCTFSSLTENKTVTATFTLNTYTVTANGVGNGSGTITGNLSGDSINATWNGSTLTGDNTATVNYGSGPYTVTGSANTGSTVAWTSGCNSTSGNGTTSATCTLNSPITSAKSITATFTLNQYTVTPSAGAGGTINPSTPQTVNYNQTTSFTVTPNTGYHTSSVNGTCGGTLVGNTYTTNAVTADCTVAASFAINTYTVTPSAGAGGTINPSTPQTVNYNATTSFTVTPNTGYHIVSIGGTCGGSLVGNTYTTNAVTADCTVVANFAINTYTVTPSAGANGTINPSTPQTVNYNATTSFTVTPNTGYHISSVGGTCGGSLVGNTYTTNAITADCTVVANFAINTYTVTPSAGANGSINPSTPQTVNYNQTTSFTVTPNTGYHISSVTGTCGGSLVGNTYTTNAVTADCTVVANFAINTYTVTPSAGTGGTINPSTPQTVNYNATPSFTVTPSTGYHITSVNGTCGGTLVGNTYTTNAITADCTVVASFAIDTHTVTPSAGTGGSINPSTPQTVNYNQTTQFTVTPNTGYHAVMSGTCGGSLVGNTYTTNAITADCTVVASFAINTYTVTPSAGSGGTINPSTPQTVNYNQTIQFTVTPNAGYHIVSVMGCGGTLAGNTYSTGSITSNCGVSANFAADVSTHTITASAGSGGSISPSGAVSVNNGANQTFNITANSGYHIYSVSVDGAPVGTVSSYTFTNVTAAHTISAIFVADAGVSIDGTTHYNYTVNLGDGVIVTFTQITGPCTISKTTSGTPPGVAPSGYRFASNFYDISHAGCNISGAITVTIPYNESAVIGPEANLRLFHWTSGWGDVTTSVDTVNNTITGVTSSLSPFGAGYPYSGGYTTGANTYVIAFLALIAITTGVILIKKSEWLRNI